MKVVRLEEDRQIREKSFCGRGTMWVRSSSSRCFRIEASIFYSSFAFSNEWAVTKCYICNIYFKYIAHVWHTCKIYVKYILFARDTYSSLVCKYNHFNVGMFEDVREWIWEKFTESFRFWDFEIFRKINVFILTYVMFDLFNLKFVEERTQGYSIINVVKIRGRIRIFSNLNFSTFICSYFPNN